MDGIRGLFIAYIFVIGIISAASEEEITVLNRTCAAEPDVRPSHIPLDICAPSSDSCKHVIVVNEKYKVLCDTVTEGGDWIVIQRRPTATPDFHARNWTDYQLGFGEIDDTFWYGLENIHKLCPEQEPCEMRIEFMAKGQERFAKYKTFALSGAWENYQLTVDGFNGQGDLMSQANGMQFVAEGSPDPLSYQQCLTDNGAWWFERSCNTTTLNGLDVSEKSLYTEMKIRRMASKPVEI